MSAIASSALTTLWPCAAGGLKPKRFSSRSRNSWKDEVKVFFAMGGNIVAAMPDWQVTAAYYPEVNPLVPLQAHDPMSFTPSYKGVPIRIVAAGSEAEAA